MFIKAIIAADLSLASAGAILRSTGAHAQYYRGGCGGYVRGCGYRGLGVGAGNGRGLAGGAIAGSAARGY